MKLSVIIPAYNEAERIGATLRSIGEYLSRQEYEYEILVVNDGSSDNTASVVRSFKNRVPHLRLIDNVYNHGKGWVVRQGMLQAVGDMRLFMDADNSTTIDHIERCFPRLARGADVVITSRRTEGSEVEIEQSKFREWLGAVFRWLVRVAVPVGVSDSQNGFKVFTARAAKEIFERQTISTWAFDVEVLVLARAFGYKVDEVPIRWINDDRTHVTLRGMLRMLGEVMQIRINLIKGLYTPIAPYGMRDPAFGSPRGR